LSILIAKGNRFSNRWDSLTYEALAINRSW
jgi:hypothetical protein